MCVFNSANDNSVCMVFWGVLLVGYSPDDNFVCGVIVLWVFLWFLFLQCSQQFFVCVMFFCCCVCFLGGCAVDNFVCVYVVFLLFFVFVFWQCSQQFCVYVFFGCVFVLAVH